MCRKIIGLLILSSCYAQSRLDWRLELLRPDWSIFNCHLPIRGASSAFLNPHRWATLLCSHVTAQHITRKIETSILDIELCLKQQLHVVVAFHPFRSLRRPVCFSLLPRYESPFPRKTDRPARLATQRSHFRGEYQKIHFRQIAVRSRKIVPPLRAFIYLLFVLRVCVYVGLHFSLEIRAKKSFLCLKKPRGSKHSSTSPRVVLPKRLWYQCAIRWNEETGTYVAFGW